MFSYIFIHIIQIAQITKDLVPLFDPKGMHLFENSVLKIVVQLPYQYRNQGLIFLIYVFCLGRPKWSKQWSNKDNQMYNDEQMYNDDETRRQKLVGQEGKLFLARWYK